jgi:predicted protein tyrosine phosphatase
MVEIHPDLFVGSQDDYERTVRRESGWKVVHACKEPYHRQALGYTGRAISKTHPEYLVAPRGDRLMLNLIDTDDPDYIPREIMDAALDFIHQGLKSGSRVLVHCNQGQSRAPSIGLLYLGVHTDRLARDFADARAAFQVLYPRFSPAAGVHGFLRSHWSSYVAAGKVVSSGPDAEGPRD